MPTTSELTRTQQWFTEVDEKQGVDVQKLAAQIAAHVEEVKEFYQALDKLVEQENEDGVFKQEIETLEESRKKFANGLYNTDLKRLLIATNDDNRAIKTELVDSLCDQIVTATGVLSRTGFNAEETLSRVNDSNFTKFDDNGDPIFNEFGKVTSGPNYKKPDFTDLVEAAAIEK